MDNNFVEFLPVEQRKALIEKRIQQFAQEAYQHLLNIETAKSLNANEQVEKEQQSIDILQAAINVHKAELDKLAE